jgi:hypothetical protein
VGRGTQGPCGDAGDGGCGSNRAVHRVLCIDIGAPLDQALDHSRLIVAHGVVEWS